MDKQKQIEEIARYCCNACEFGNVIDLENNIYPCAIDNEYKTCHLALETAEKIYAAGYRKQSEVTEEYRQRVNVKMGKHTHLLGKEYVQRILREVAKEMKGGE